jgi:quinohemoprotein ethanol dehydrogenase
MKKFPITLLCFAATALCAAAVAWPQSEVAGKDFGKFTQWKKHVSAQERSRTNPLAADAKSVAAGAQVYGERCARCHGADANGHGRKPGLRGPDTTSSTDGELFWLLTNGDLAHGMPAWPQMPEPERWQLVTYLRSLSLPK